MIIFRVVGPLEVHRSRESGGRIIADEDVGKFWQSNEKYANRRGCYVFGRRARKGYTPGYVGKATKGLKQEIFTPDKLNKFTKTARWGIHGLINSGRGKVNSDTGDFRQMMGISP